MSRAACSAPSAKCGAGVASGARASWAFSLSFGIALGRPRHPTVLCLCECVFVKRLGANACYARIAQRFTWTNRRSQDVGLSENAHCSVDRVARDKVYKTSRDTWFLTKVRLAHT